MPDLLKRPDALRAIELYALNPDITAKEVAKDIGVSTTLIYIWRKNPNFVEAIYDRYMIKFGGELPAVLQAMIREAKAGNVQAGRLVLEHSGKLVKNVNITIDSPYEKFLKANNAEVEYEDAEVEEIVDSMPDIDVPLPERNPEKQKNRTNKERKKLRTALQKENRKKKKREWYRWYVRAEKAGIETLPTKRPTPAQRKTWEEKIIKYEEEQKEKQQG